MHTSAVQRACDTVGSASELARRLGVKPPTVSEWRTGDRPIPIERCVDIERVTDGYVRRWDLRPTDWYRIWPELIGAEGAPVPPAPIEADAQQARAA